MIWLGASREEKYALWHYKRIPCWINRGRVKTLKEFKRQVIRYFDNASFSWDSIHPAENAEAEEARSAINLMAVKAGEIVRTSGVSSVIVYEPPPALGGACHEVDVIRDIFHLRLFWMGKKDVLDVVERAIGVYEDDAMFALLRTVNPIFWVQVLIETLLSVPFMLLGGLGLDQQRIETSVLGRAFKWLCSVAAWVASVLTIIDWWRTRAASQ